MTKRVWAMAEDASVRPVPDTILTAAAFVVECTRALDDPVIWIHEPLLSDDEVAALGGVHRADSVAALQAQACMIIVGAYDGESALFWRRD